MGKQWKQWLYFLRLQNHCSHEIKRQLLLGRTAMTNLDNVLKRRDITLPTKVHLVKAMVFPVVMYGCEIWTIKKAECWRIDAFELWCWRRLLRVPWRSNQSVLKEWTVITHWRDWFWSWSATGGKKPTPEKTLMMRKIEGKRRRGNRGWDGWMASLTQSTWVWANSRRQWRTERPGMLQFMGSQRVRHDLATKQQQHSDGC